MPSRRLFMGSTVALSLNRIARAAPADAGTTDPSKVVALFSALPGESAIKIWAPATDKKPELLTASNAESRMFVGSAIKTFILAESLRQADTPDIVKTITT